MNGIDWLMAIVGVSSVITLLCLAYSEWRERKRWEGFKSKRGIK